MSNHNDDECSDSKPCSSMKEICNTLDNNGIKVEEYHLLKKNISRDGLHNKLNDSVKVNELLLLQESTLYGLDDQLCNNDIKVEEFPWWEDKNTDEYLQVKEEHFTKDDTVRQRERKVTQGKRIQTGERSYQCNQCDKAFSNNGNLKKTHEDSHWGEAISMQPVRQDFLTKL